VLAGHVHHDADAADRRAGPVGLPVPAVGTAVAGAAATAMAYGVNGLTVGNRGWLSIASANICQIPFRPRPLRE
jgi:hypothetical protein